MIVKIRLKLAGLVTSIMMMLGCGNSGKVLEAQSQLSEGISIYDLSIPSLTGDDTISFSQFKGKKLLIVNVASKCGYTYQYEGLQELYEAKNDQLEIIGLPCNQFLMQEPGTDEEIASFCEEYYGVTFSMTTKIDVKGENQHEIYQWLTQKKLNGKDDFAVTWNFNKFLISENGELLAYFSSDVKPMSAELISHLK
jgi:glutathione peroxidase